MDVARYGDWATLAYTNAKVRENYSRRFRITFPNEELPAARPLHTTPIYDRLDRAQRGVGRRLRPRAPAVVPDARAAQPVEDVTFHRSNAFPLVAEECRAVRERVGLTETSNFAKYRVVGTGRRRLAAGPVHQPAAEGRPHRPDGDAQPAGAHRRASSRSSRIGDDDFFLFGSQAAEVHHSRWFLDHLPGDGSADPTFRGARPCRWSA